MKTEREKLPAPKDLNPHCCLAPATELATTLLSSALRRLPQSTAWSLNELPSFPRTPQVLVLGVDYLKPDLKSLRFPWLGQGGGGGVFNV